jgi:TrmH family RNA methyltransferase
MLKIESAQNETFKKFLGLTSAKGLKKEGLFLLSGQKLATEFLAAPRLKIIAELTAPGLPPSTTSSHPAAQQIQLSSELFAQIDVLGTHSNILVLEQPPMAVLESRDLESYAPQGIEIVMPTGDPGNLGALIRSCEAFAVPRVILTEEAAHPFLPKTVKASAGSVLRLPLARGPALREFPASCIALDPDGASLYDFEWPAEGLLVVGEEGPGFGADGKPGTSRFHQRLCIPTQNVESLNVVVAVSIALAHKARCSNPVGGHAHGNLIA